MVRNGLLKPAAGNTSKASFNRAVQQVIDYCNAGSRQVGLFAQADFFAEPKREPFHVPRQAYVVAEDKNSIVSKVQFSHVFSAFFQNVHLTGLSFCFKQRFKTCPVNADAWVRFASDHFSEDLLPSFCVCSHIVQLVPVDFYVQWRLRWTIQDAMEGYVSAYAMREEKAGDYALVNYV
jgi:hypothetical protein